MPCTKFIVTFVFLLLSATSVFSQNFNIVIDYSLDTNNFFNTQAKRDALQAAADRWSNIITSPLTAVGPGGTSTGTSAGWRIGFSHPGLGGSWEVSTAANSASDPLIGSGASPANQYGFAGLQANQWILYAGGRSLGGPAGIGGTGTGTNFFGTANDLQGPLHRGVISNTPTATFNDIPAWGGAITFETALAWHFGINTAAPSGTTDFYSIALHEIGHALGLSVTFNQWANFQVGATFTGPKAVAALNSDNLSSLTALNTVSAGNFHWADGIHKSFIFAPGGPNLSGTVGTGVLQDLLMDPVANFNSTLRRFEVTNVEIGAIQDLGWSVLSVPELSSILYMGGILVFVGYGYSRRRSVVTELAVDENTPTITEAEPTIVE